MAQAELDPGDLDLAHLAYFAGLHFNTRLLEALHRAGYAGVRQSHGYVIQHLIAAPISVTALARRLQVSQQAASKTVAEMVGLGYLEDGPALDGRTRSVRISRRGWRMVKRARDLRIGMLAQALAALPERDIDAARRVLLACLEAFGGAPAVRGRRVVEPR